MTQVLSTAMARATGTYYVSASIALILGQGDTVVCSLGTSNGLQGYYARVGAVENEAYETIPLDQAVLLSAGDSVRVYCADYTSDPSTEFYDGGVTATLIDNAAGNVAKAGTATRHSLPRTGKP